MAKQREKRGAMPIMDIPDSKQESEEDRREKVLMTCLRVYI